MGKNDIDIIICCRNNADIISRCMDSIACQTSKNFNCIAVDDQSKDGTLEILKKKYPWVRVIEKPEWTGPSHSRNIALGSSRSEYIATLDSDVQLDKDWIKEQLRLMKDGTTGIGASKILYSWDKRRINSCGGSITKLGFGFDINSGLGKENGTQKKAVLYGHSAAMIVRRKMLEEIGNFDETYFYGNEDTDIGWRANMAGWKVVFNPRALAYHDENSTIRKMSRSVAFHGTKNRIRSLIKNYSFMNIAKYMPIHVFLILGKTVMSSNKEARLHALLWNLLHLPSTLKARRSVQKTRKIRDTELMRLFSRRLPRKSAMK